MVSRNTETLFITTLYKRQLDLKIKNLALISYTHHIFNAYHIPIADYYKNLEPSDLTSSFPQTFQPSISTTKQKSTQQNTKHHPHPHREPEPTNSSKSHQPRPHPPKITKCVPLAPCSSKPGTAFYRCHDILPPSTPRASAKSSSSKLRLSHPSRSCRKPPMSSSQSAVPATTAILWSPSPLSLATTC